MPELPEVETVKRGLSELLVGHKIRGYVILRDKSFSISREIADNHLVGARITGIRRRAKLIIIDLDNKFSLIIHLKMTGQLVYLATNSHKRFGAGHPNDSLVNKLPDNSTRVIFLLDNAKLFFNDQRVFGWIKLLPTDEISRLEFIKKLGPEPLEPQFKPEILKQRLQKRKYSSIKAVLLDQSIVAGIGNIYADETLWLAKIHPERKVHNLNQEDINELHKAIVSTLKTGIDKGGSTDRNYVDAQGNKGSYLEFAKVFRREDNDCLRCGSMIVKIRSAGRGTHLCQICQI